MDSNPLMSPTRRGSETPSPQQRGGGGGDAAAEGDGGDARGGERTVSFMRDSEAQDTTAYANMSTMSRASMSSVALLAPPQKLGTLLGVFVPCMLAIFGAILFLRLGWGIGQAGLLGLIGMLALAGTLVTLTALSVSAISTNGSMKGGGAYFMISRSLGPEFGASVGIIFYMANAVGVAFYLTAFSENFTDTFMSSATGRQKVVVSIVALIALTGVALAGASFFSKLNVYILGIVVFSIISSFLSLLIVPISTPSSGYTGVSGSTLDGNMLPHFDSGNDYWTVFAVIFPAVTGIMAGANMSGDLTDPGKSIGPGTLSAIGTSLVVYTGLAIVLAATVKNSELRDNYSIIQDTAWWKYSIAVGVWASTLSSALGGITGAARILQALARDNLLDFLAPFAKGSEKGDEPIRGVLFTFGVALASVLPGNLNVIAGVISNAFLLVYFFTNLACFVLKISGAPNFRPLFRYFSWQTALAGAVMCLVVMFLTDPLYAAFSILLTAGVFAYVVYTGPVTPWGDVKQALIFHQVRKYLLRLDQRSDAVHAKFWRPSLLYIPGSIEETPMALIDFCNSLKKGGLYVIGDVIEGSISSRSSAARALQETWLELIDTLEVKAFAEVMVADTWRAGVCSLMQSSGLGGMKPNTVVLPIPDMVNQDEELISRRRKRGLGKQRVVAVDSTQCIRLRKKIARLHACVMSTPAALMPDLARLLNDDEESGTGAVAPHHRSFATENPIGESEMVRSVRGTDPNITYDPEDVSDRMEAAAGAADGSAESKADNDDDSNTSHGTGNLAADANGDSAEEWSGANGTQQLSSHSHTLSFAQEGSPVLHDTYHALLNALFLQRNVLLTRNFHKLQVSEFAANANESATPMDRLRRTESAILSTVDVWINLSSLQSLLEVYCAERQVARPSRQYHISNARDLNFLETHGETVDIDNTIALQLQLAYGLHRTDNWETSTRIRLMVVVDDYDMPEKIKRDLDELLRTVRVVAETVLVPVNNDVLADALDAPGMLQHASEVGVLNWLMRKHTENTALIFMCLPTIGQTSNDTENAAHARASVMDTRRVLMSNMHIWTAAAAAEAYMQSILTLTNNVPPIVLTLPASSSSIITTAI